MYCILNLHTVRTYYVVQRTYIEILRVAPNTDVGVSCVRRYGNREKNIACKMY